MLFIQTLWTNPVYFCMVCLIVTFSVCVHEYFHAQAAVWEGDYTLQDHLTLNPMKQMGLMSLVMVVAAYVLALVIAMGVTGLAVIAGVA